MQNDARARITVFSDYVCPFCYLGKPDLAREEYGGDGRGGLARLRAEVRFRPDPDGYYLHYVERLRISDG